MEIRKLVFIFAFLSATLASAPASVSAQDEWRRVRSKNFNLIGSAAEADIRQVAVKLEQFREALRRVLGAYNFNSPVPTNVIVFKNADDYKPYKPLKANGEANEIVAGFFQGGRDVNYITLSIAAGDEAKTYGTIFHEYTHFLIRNNFGESKIPAWYNEGIANYYETLRVEDDRKITLGAAQNKFLPLLGRYDLIPFDVFFNADNSELHEHGKDAVGLFYAQAWALTHYLIHGKGGARTGQLDKFLSLLLAGKSPKTAFAEAFQTDYATIETELKSYIEKKSYAVKTVTLEEKLSFDSEMETEIVSDYEVKAYLGDLLLHLGRLSEAETHLDEALKSNPDSVQAQISLGLLKIQQGDFAAAQAYLEKAVDARTDNYLVYFMHAYGLSREGMTGFGFIVHYDRETARAMRESLRKAIALNPAFAESYDLYAFVGIVRNEELDESIAYLNRALEIAPGNQWYLIHLAELYLRREDFAKAKSIAAKVTRTAGDKELKVYAQNTLGRIVSTEAAFDDIKNNRKQPQDYVSETPLTDEELAARRALQMNESLNESLYKTKLSEKRILGYLTRIDCEPKEMIYLFRTGDKVLKLRSPSFDAVRFVAFNADLTDSQIGCGELKKASFAVVNYRPAAGDKTATAGEIVSIEFVPANFRFSK